MRKRREILSKTRLVSRGERSLRRRIGQEEELFEKKEKRVKENSDERKVEYKNEGKNKGRQKRSRME